MDNSVCGLCGDNNGDPSDDMVTPGNQPKDNAVDFGMSWGDSGDPRGEDHVDKEDLLAAEELKQNDLATVSSSFHIIQYHF